MNYVSFIKKENNVTVNAAGDMIRRAAKKLALSMTVISLSSPLSGLNIAAHAEEVPAEQVVAEAQTAEAAEAQAPEGQEAVAVGYAYEATPEELVLMANVVVKEAGPTDLAGQVAVAQVIMNRVMSPAFPNTISEVLSQKHQFTTYASAAAVPAEQTSPEVIAVCQGVISGGHNVLNNNSVLFFRRYNGKQTFNGRNLFVLIGMQAFYA